MGGTFLCPGMGSNYQKAAAIFGLDTISLGFKSVFGNLMVDIWYVSNNAWTFLCPGMESNHQRAAAGRGEGSQNFFSQHSSGELSSNRCLLTKCCVEEISDKLPPQSTFHNPFKLN